MSTPNQSRIVGPLAATLMAVGILAVVAASAADPGPGCDLSRRAVAHHAGGATLETQPEGAPIPCFTTFGESDGMALVAVDHADGTVFGGPLIDDPMWTTPVGGSLYTKAARSSDRGGTWATVVPPFAHHTGFQWMSVDPETSRLWVASVGGGFAGVTAFAAKISWTDDQGATWHDNPVTCPNTQGELKLLEGPAPQGGSQPMGYPHVVYYCANMSAGEGPVMHCYKSLDGGMLFTPAGGIPDLICGDGSIGNARAGAVGPDGALYFPVDDVCAGGLGLAISDDEGATWRHLPVVAPTTATNLRMTSLGVDADGNLYLAWLGEGDLPYLTTSSDRGQNWSAPMAVGAPGVNATRNAVALAVGEPGHVAIAYLGSTDGGVEFDGYITESRTALAPGPLFWSAAVNDPNGSPLVLGATSEGLLDREYFRTAVIGPDGTPWAGYHCRSTPICPNARIGVVGRLAWP